MNGDDERALWDPLFHGTPLRNVFSTVQRLADMLAVESALAHAQWQIGMIPERACRAILQASERRPDFVSLADGSAKDGNIAIGLVQWLRAQVREIDPDAAQWVHHGATSQDIEDTALMLQMKAANRILCDDLFELADATASRVTTHEAALICGRTWLQPAVPIPFGLKLAGWLDALTRHGHRLIADRQLLAVQFGGAAGSLASLGEHGPEVARRLGERLQLVVPPISWHTHRDRLVQQASTVAMIGQTLGKIGSDIALLGQSEVREMTEMVSEGHGGSSSMPNKSNPVGCGVMMSASIRIPGMMATLYGAMVQQHERGLGGWHAEWETVPDLWITVGGALSRSLSVIRDARIDEAVMASNLEATYETVYAESVALQLATRMGREKAHRTIASACAAALQQRTPLSAVLKADPAVQSHFDAATVAQWFSAASSVAATPSMIHEVLGRWNALKQTLNGTNS